MNKYVLFIAMKLAFLLTLVLTFQAYAGAKAQRITLTVKNEPLFEVIKEVQKQSGYAFLFSMEYIKKARPVSISVKNSSLEELLPILFKDQPFQYSVHDKILRIEPKPAVRPDTKPIHLLQQNVSGNVTDQSGNPLQGVTVAEKGTTRHTITDDRGNFVLPRSEGRMVLVFSMLGFNTIEREIGNQTTVNCILTESISDLDEVVVVGYGTQKKSDITGTVASIPKERLDMVPNLNIAQAIQGAIPGIQIQQTASGASPNESIIIRGRNSIQASNSPLIVVDGIPYGGALSDINPNDIQSIEILKDASAAAIYGSRGSNGVILVTSMKGIESEPKIKYDGYYSRQNFSNYPDYMNGAEYYDYKMTRFAGSMTDSEKRIYEAGEWVDWTDLGTRSGRSQQHNLSVSGGGKSSKYYLSGNILDVKGLLINDDYMRATGRVNLDTKISSWLTIGTQTQLAYTDESGIEPDVSNLSRTNPLTKAYEEDGSLAIYIWDEIPTTANPLQSTLFDNSDHSYQVISNNFAMIDFPFVKGLSYRLNTGLRYRTSADATFMGRNTKDGLEARGSSVTGRSESLTSVIENVFSYNRSFGAHTIGATAVYSYEKNKSAGQTLSASGFPNDFLKWYSAAQAELVTPAYDFNENTLMSQMLRLNYSYDSRYLLTLTGRRDGFSGFGIDTKWGIFPSIALGWNLANESFFSLKHIFSELKPRVSYGLNGNQAVGAYESISRLSELNMVSGKQTVAGYVPSKLGQETLGWESSTTLNIGADVGLFKGRVTGDINFFKTHTHDLLLNRSISSVHGITSIIQNIGKTANTGFEFGLQSKNIVTPQVTWSTSVNAAFTKNKIVSLYGELDESGREIDDLSNAWFIGKPIMVNYDFVWDGTWQLHEAEEAAKWGSQPGFVKLRDVDGNGQLTGEDRQIIGQTDPKFIWGLTNSFSYKNFILNIFIHGVHGVTKQNSLMSDYTTADIRRSTINKKWWTPENPTNDWIVNHLNAEWMAGVQGYIYEDASFIRVKDISLAYDIPPSTLTRYKVDKLRVFFTARNSMTFTKWRGLDPELNSQRQAPLQREFVMGLNLGF